MESLLSLTSFLRKSNCPSTSCNFWLLCSISFCKTSNSWCSATCSSLESFSCSLMLACISSKAASTSVFAVLSLSFKGFIISSNFPISSLNFFNCSSLESFFASIFSIFLSLRSIISFSFLRSLSSCIFLWWRSLFVSGPEHCSPEENSICFRKSSKRWLCWRSSCSLAFLAIRVVIPSRATVLGSFEGSQPSNMTSRRLSIWERLSSSSLRFSSISSPSSILPVPISFSHFSPTVDKGTSVSPLSFCPSWVSWMGFSNSASSMVSSLEVLLSSSRHFARCSASACFSFCFLNLEGNLNLSSLASSSSIPISRESTGNFSSIICLRACSISVRSCLFRFASVRFSASPLTRFSINCCFWHSSSLSSLTIGVASALRIKRASITNVWISSEILSSFFLLVWSAIISCNPCTTSVACSVSILKSLATPAFCLRRSTNISDARAVSLSIASWSLSISSSSLTFFSTSSSMNSDCGPLRPPVLRLCNIFSLVPFSSEIKFSLLSISPLILESDSLFIFPFFLNCIALMKFCCSWKISPSRAWIFSIRLSLFNRRTSSCLTSGLCSSTRIELFLSNWSSLTFSLDNFSFSSKAWIICIGSLKPASLSLLSSSLIFSFRHCNSSSAATL